MMCPDPTLQALTKVRQIKGGDGHHLWAQSLQPGVPSTLLGFPVWTTDAMPAPGQGSFPLCFGNWRRGYMIADRIATIRVTVDEVTTPGQARFYVRRRVGGLTLNNYSMKLLKF